MEVMLQAIDAGVIVLDREFNVEVINSFVENHSGIRSSQAKGRNFFTLFPEIDEAWFRHKAESVFMLESRAFSSWQQRPYLLKFNNYRPITGSEEFMYQNVTITPIMSLNASIDHICIFIYDVTDIAVHKKELSLANSKLEALSRTDQLTHLNNRGFWESRLKYEFNRYLRYGQHACLVMLDIDHFKSINDKYGHHVGDEVLKTVAGIIKDTVRTTDVAGRYGGEEFGIILLNCNSEKAFHFSERLRKSIENKSMLPGEKNINITISLGIAEFNEDIEDHVNLIECADKALYRSKNMGRNKTMVFAA